MITLMWLSPSSLTQMTRLRSHEETVEVPVIISRAITNVPATLNSPLLRPPDRKTLSIMSLHSVNNDQQLAVTHPSFRQMTDSE